MNGPAEMDECETPEDNEPSLASMDRSVNRTKWSAGNMSDIELDDSDAEPSLGRAPTITAMAPPTITAPRLPSSTAKAPTTTRGYGYGSRRLRNLSDRQREILGPKVNRSKVTV